MPTPREGELERDTLLLARGSPPEKMKIFSAFMCVLMGFYAFGTRFQS